VRNTRQPGPTRVITDLCVFEPDPETKELVVVSLHPGVSREHVIEATGWEIRFAARWRNPEPSANELEDPARAEGSAPRGPWRCVTPRR
jgi:acyl CoA:acetate/3-ketoacid CoA transferase beta subunit